MEAPFAGQPHRREIAGKDFSQRRQDGPGHLRSLPSGDGGVVSLTAFPLCHLHGHVTNNLFTSLAEMNRREREWTHRWRVR